MTKIVTAFLTVIMFIFPTLNIPEKDYNADEWNTEYTYVFVH